MELDPGQAFYRQLISHLVLQCASLELYLAGLADFLVHAAVVTEEDLVAHVERYRDQHEVEMRAKFIAMLHGDPETFPGDDLKELFGSPPQFEEP